MTIAYALLRDGRIITIPEPDRLPSLSDTLFQAVKHAGLKSPAMKATADEKGTYYVGDLDRRAPDDVMHAELWGEPIPDSPAKAIRDGLLYGWTPGNLDQVAEAYRLAGGVIDDYLRDLA